MWMYDEAGKLLTLRSIGAEDCIYCRYRMHRMKPLKFEQDDLCYLVQLSICLRCGWWYVYRVHQGEHPRSRDLIEGYSGAIGSLKELDLEDVSAPLDEVRQYLLAKRDAVFRVHPRLFEEVVCSVFRSFGWTARVTAYSGDEGIDVILDSGSGKTVGVQVKRYQEKAKIEAEQIRSLAGALIINGLTKGVFVTTSSFRKGAKRTANKLSSIGYPIELVDAARFFDALDISHHRDSPLDQDRIISYMLAPGIHLGAGLRKDLEPGENLMEREIAGQIWVTDELIELRGEST